MESFKRYSIQILRVSKYSSPTWAIIAEFEDRDTAIERIKGIPLNSVTIWKRVGINNGIGFEREYIYFLE